MRLDRLMMTLLALALMNLTACEVLDDLADADGGSADSTGTSDVTGAACGDGTCATDEYCDTCPDDCGACDTPSCGDGACTQGEDCGSCPQDCDCPCECDHNVQGVCEADHPGTSASCACDPDCDSQGACISDGHCDTYCPDGDDPDCNTACDKSAHYDPDCKTSQAACSCDYHNDVCEMEVKHDANMKPCYCDSDCYDEFTDPCVDEGHCDTWCPAGQDPDC